MLKSLPPLFLPSYPSTTSSRKSGGGGRIALPKICFAGYDALNRSVETSYLGLWLDDGQPEPYPSLADRQNCGKCSFNKCEGLCGLRFLLLLICSH